MGWIKDQLDKMHGEYPRTGDRRFEKGGGNVKQSPPPKEQNMAEGDSPSKTMEMIKTLFNWDRGVQLPSQNADRGTPYDMAMKGGGPSGSHPGDFGGPKPDNGVGMPPAFREAFDLPKSAASVAQAMDAPTGRRPYPHEMPSAAPGNNRPSEVNFGGHFKWPKRINGRPEYPSDTRTTPAIVSPPPGVEKDKSINPSSPADVPRATEAQQNITSPKGKPLDKLGTAEADYRKYMGEGDDKIKSFLERHGKMPIEEIRGTPIPRQQFGGPWKQGKNGLRYQEPKGTPMSSEALAKYYAGNPTQRTFVNNKSMNRYATMLEAGLGIGKELPLTNYATNLQQKLDLEKAAMEGKTRENVAKINASARGNNDDDIMGLLEQDDQGTEMPVNKDELIAWMDKEQFETLSGKEKLKRFEQNKQMARAYNLIYGGGK